MSGWIANFKGKNGTNTFANRKEDINRKGQPRKGIALINNQLEELWYKPAKKVDIETCYMVLFQLEENVLLDLAKNKDKPMLIRILAKNLLSWKGFDTIEKMIDRWIWKPTQAIEERLVDKDWNDKNINPIINIISWKSKIIE